MTNPHAQQLTPPRNWDDFEELCADLFQLVWEDDYVVRHGRQGQRQNGVDIYGQKDRGNYIGVQCKGKSTWPPKALTTIEIDKEVAKALAFSPTLSNLIFATTAPDDAAIQAHARDITTKHQTEGLFDVTVYGWGEILRRLTQYPALLEKYYGQITLESLQETLEDTRQNVLKVLSAQAGINVEPINREIDEEVWKLRKKRKLFGTKALDDTLELSKRALKGDLSGGDNESRSFAIAWCARILSNLDTEKAEKVLTEAENLHSSPTVNIAKSLIASANGDTDAALESLARIGSTEALSAAFTMLTLNKSFESAMQWLEKVQLSFSDLDPDGKHVFLAASLNEKNWSEAKLHADALTDDDYNHTPALLFLSAISYLAVAMPTELRQVATTQVPLNPKDFPLSSDATALDNRRTASRLFKQCSDVAAELGASDASNIAFDFHLWLELRDPATSDSALNELRRRMRNASTALHHLNLALRFGLDVDLDQVEKEIERQVTLSGNKSTAAAIARFVLAFTKRDPKEVSTYIAQYRQELEGHIAPAALASIEVEALVKSGQADKARNLLQSLEQQINDTRTIEDLGRLIDGSGSSDEIDFLISDYDRDQSYETLERLVSYLAASEDWPLALEYSEALFEKSHSVRDAERLADVLNRLGKDQETYELLKKYPEFLSQSASLVESWCWTLLRLGLIVECEKALEDHSSQLSDNTLSNLQVNLAVTAGNWAQIGSVVERDWAQRSRKDAFQLLVAAQRAKMIGSPRSREFTQLAVRIGNHDPNVLLQAYSIAVNEGWETEGDVSDWLERAAELSDEDGPVKTGTMEELVQLIPERRDHADAVWQMLKQGEVPYYSAAQVLNRPHVGTTLAASLSNMLEHDPRRRSAIYAFSGQRPALAVKPLKHIFLDVSAILTLTLLEILDDVLGYSERVTISPSTLNWLFEEKRQVQFHQPSRIEDAQTLRQLVDDKSVHEFFGTAKVDQDLVEEVGEELARLIAEAETPDPDTEQQQIVAVPYPVTVAGSLSRENADLSNYFPILCSCSALVEKLFEKGMLKQAELEESLADLARREVRWPEEPKILDGAKVYLDNLSVVYLSHLDLLKHFKGAGLQVYISPTNIEEARSLLGHAQQSDRILGKIEVIRKALSEGIQQGTVQLAPMVGAEPTDPDTANLEYHPTNELLRSAGCAEAVVIDDRFLNKHANIDIQGTLIPIQTTSDLLDFMLKEGAISADIAYNRLTALRQAGFICVPVTSAELLHHITEAPTVDDKLIETAELKAIRENTLQVRMTTSLLLPDEAPWLDMLLSAVFQTLEAIWSVDAPHETTKKKADWLIQLFRIRGWEQSSSTPEAVDTISQRRALQIKALIALATGLPDQNKEEYRAWLEETVIEPLAHEEKEVFQILVDHFKENVLSVATTLDGEANE